MQDSDFKIPRKFPWKTWADFAYKNKVKLVNWPSKGPVPSKNLKDIKTDLNTRMLADMVHPRDRQAGLSLGP